ncbi:ECF-type sigma factor [Bryobacter aggregatus]|uniref:ECF-type sigma factor n=1 Tax=Bryobacter aggregatus TaxID=360054 RepID=UPI0004E11C2C|nr:ECF-type sigma factor [Bryobacter aggregatus]
MHSAASTELLSAYRQDNSIPEHRLFQVVNGKLKSIARKRLGAERPGSLQPTELISEAYEKMLSSRSQKWQDEIHFLAVASRVMRQILIDYARRRNALKRGNGLEPVELQESHLVDARDLDLILSVKQVLAQLSRLDTRQAEIVGMMYFDGLTQEEVAQSIGVEVRTVKREWGMARAWMAKRLTTPASEALRRFVA